MNKKILLSLGMLAFVGAAVVGGTGAFFSDTIVADQCSCRCHGHRHKALR